MKERIHHQFYKRQREARVLCQRSLTNALWVALRTAFFWVALLVILLPILWLLRPFDSEILTLVRHPEALGLTKLARAISNWGDFFKINIILLVLGMPLAFVFKSRKWQRYLMAIFLSALLAGVFVQLRAGLGRARPSSGSPDAFYGPSLSSHYHSFPSGHSATAFATAMTASLLCPPLAVVALPAA